MFMVLCSNSNCNKYTCTYTTANSVANRDLYHQIKQCALKFHTIESQDLRQKRHCCYVYPKTCVHMCQFILKGA